jgi:hypothetical protein
MAGRVEATIKASDMGKELQEEAVGVARSALVSESPVPCNVISPLCEVCMHVIDVFMCVWCRTRRRSSTRRLV